MEREREGLERKGEKELGREKEIIECNLIVTLEGGERERGR